MQASQLRGVPALEGLREQQQPYLRVSLPQPGGGLGALVGVGGRHPDVDDGDVRAVLGDGRLELLAVADQGDRLDAGLGQQPCESFAQQHRVIGDHDPHGSSPIRVVPALVSDCTDRLPPSASVRSAMPRRPVPVGSAPPRPSSVTRTRSIPF